MPNPTDQTADDQVTGVGFDEGILTFRRADGSKLDVPLESNEVTSWTAVWFPASDVYPDNDGFPRPAGSTYIDNIITGNGIEFRDDDPEYGGDAVVIPPGRWSLSYSIATRIRDDEPNPLKLTITPDVLGLPPDWATVSILHTRSMYMITKTQNNPGQVVEGEFVNGGGTFIVPEPGAYVSLGVNLSGRSEVENPSFISAIGIQLLKL